MAADSGIFQQSAIRAGRLSERQLSYLRQPQVADCSRITFPSRRASVMSVPRTRPTTKRSPQQDDLVPGELFRTLRNLQQGVLIGNAERGEDRTTWAHAHVAIIGHAAGNHLSPTLEAVLPQSGASASVVASGGKVICARIQRNN